MGLRLGTVVEPYLRSTRIENIFINEYMPLAPADYVKVYLYALMYAELGKNLENDQIAEECGLEEEDVLKAWTYWENLNVIRKIYDEGADRFHFDVEFVSLRNLLYGKHKPEDKNIPSICDNELKDMFDDVAKLIKRPLGGTEPVDIMSWVTDFGANAEMILYAYSYCVKTKAVDSVNYVGKVVKSWAEKGLKSAEEIEKYLADTDRRHFQYKRVLQSLGFSRNATEAEKSIIDRWFDEFGFSIEKVLEACGKTSGISSPNINYVNKVLSNWHSEAKDTGEEKKPAPLPKSDIVLVNAYMEHLRNVSAATAEMHKREVYAKLPRVKEIEDELISLNLSISKTMISTNANKAQQIAKLRNEIAGLNKEKDELLVNNGYEKDYLDRKYKCSICLDTGKTDEGLRCACMAKRMDEAREWETK